MEKISQKTFNGERDLFSSHDLIVEECEFFDGESPLKESENIEVINSTFHYKYPLWYGKNIKVKDTKFVESARSGIWYTENISLEDCQIDVPKTFRNSKHIKLTRCNLPKASETLWGCEDIKLTFVKANGDYFGAHSKDVEAEGLQLVGNYAFDSCQNVVIRNSRLDSKDAFWNCENVTLINCTIIGEYIGWNTKKLTLIHCTVESHQGFCYVDGLIMHHCYVNNSDLIFEYCHDIDAEIVTVVDSIKNPYNGKIVVKDVKELILDRKFINPAKVKIIKQ